MSERRMTTVASIFVLISLVLSVLTPFEVESETAVINSGTVTTTRQSNETNYTQMCLDFIQENYPGKNITYIGSYDRIDPEIGLNYTIVDADVFPGSVPGLTDTVEVSI
ncbi:MAG: hypothetical protein V1934_08140, partial [Methanobacteriota archaeon]